MSRNLLRLARLLSLVLLAAPLLVAARPFGAMVWALPKAARKGFGAIERLPALRSSWLFLSGPVTATLVQAAVLWLWHAPGLFDLALGILVVGAIRKDGFDSRAA